MFKRLNFSKRDINSDQNTTQFILDQIKKGAYNPQDLQTQAIQQLFDMIDQYQLQQNHLGTWFGGVEPLVEERYIIAFLLGAKDFIKDNKDIYNMKTDDGITYYQLLKNMVNRYNNSSGDNSVNPDPYPEINLNGPKPNLDPVPKQPNLYPSFSKSNLDKKDKSSYTILKVTIATLLFIILSNQKVYEFTNKLIPTLLPSSCPSEIGNILHAVVFFLLFYVLLMLIK